jgi:hypothetical protein
VFGASFGDPIVFAGGLIADDKAFAERAFFPFAIFGEALFAETFALVFATPGFAAAEAFFAVFAVNFGFAEVSFLEITTGFEAFRDKGLLLATIFLPLTFGAVFDFDFPFTGFETDFAAVLAVFFFVLFFELAIMMHLLPSIRDELGCLDEEMAIEPA